MKRLRKKRGRSGCGRNGERRNRPPESTACHAAIGVVASFGLVNNTNSTDQAEGIHKEMAETEIPTLNTEPRSRSVMHSIALGSSAVYAGAIAALALGFVSRALVARILTPAELGILVTAQTVQAMTQAVGQFGSGRDSGALCRSFRENGSEQSESCGHSQSSNCGDFDRTARHCRRRLGLDPRTLIAAGSNSP